MKIVLWADPVLKKVAESVRESEFGPELEKFGADMVALMQAHNGVGLAGPQVGVSERVFVMTFPESKISQKPLIVCNPVLQLSGSTVYETEGCLSLPQIFEQVARAQSTTMRYFRPDGTEAEIELTGWDARIAQHEFDHTMGIMFINRLSRQMRNAALRRWEKIKHNYV
jgi:peptide deformylase